jgi:hypothetical protein
MWRHFQQFSPILLYVYKYVFLNHCATAATVYIPTLTAAAHFLPALLVYENSDRHILEDADSFEAASEVRKSTHRKKRAPKISVHRTRAATISTLVKNEIQTKAIHTMFVWDVGKSKFTDAAKIRTVSSQPIQVSP